MADSEVQISDIHVSFGKNRVLKGADGDIKKGSIVTFLGRNGCGKSTLLKAVTGNLKPDAGCIRIAGKLIEKYKNDEMACMLHFYRKYTKFPKI